MPDRDPGIGFKLLHLVATVIDACDRPPGREPGHPPTETIRVVATLRRLLREGTPWRGLIATEDQASGSILRRCLARWARTGLLAKVHALLVSMLRGHPDLILGSSLLRSDEGGFEDGAGLGLHGAAVVGGAQRVCGCTRPWCGCGGLSRHPTCYLSAVGAGSDRRLNE